ncbi:choice-of-anchor I family protein [Winogradskyella sp.]|uniref:choice-of-anchor I family protein n=1 Tax=Winogradskyella sp. TaxID=1883156 RepID=UPI002627B0E5|nr:choice-of-anchor I family protein [Winogradskyella sp.]
MKNLYFEKIKVLTMIFFMLSGATLVAQNFELQLLHYSDIDGNEESALDAVDEFSALMDFFQSNPTYINNTLTVTSGDLIIPGPRYFAAENSAVRALTGSNEPGHLDIAFANAFGVDVSTLGNHEFDQGPGELFDSAFLSESSGGVTFPGSEFPWLSTNMDFSQDGDFSGIIGTDGNDISTLGSQVAKYAVVTIDGETIGIVGAASPSFPTITTLGSVTVSPAPDATVNALAAEIQTSVDALTGSGVNKIILLAHMQSITIEKQLATLLDGVDIIVAGGSNTRMGDSNDTLFSNSFLTDNAFDETYPFQTTDAGGDPVLVVNVDGDYKYLGRLVVEFDMNGVLDLSALDDTINGVYPATEALVASLSATPNPTVIALRDAAQGVIDAQFSNVVGFSSVYLDGRRAQVRTQETNLGNLTADANLWYANLLNPDTDPDVDISLKNGGGIRTQIGSAVLPGGSNDPNDFVFSPPPNNEVSEGNLRATLRFDNGLVRLTMTPAELITIVEHGLSAVAPGVTPGRFPQIGGMSFVYDPNLAPGSRLVDLVVDRGDMDPSNDVVIIQNGVNVAPDGITFNLVTLNFLAGGGDGYPFDQLSAPNRLNYYLDTNDPSPVGVLANDPGNNTTFSETGQEQDALAEFMFAFHPDNASAFDVAETPADQDTRIVVAQANLQITEIFPGQSGDDLTEDWFEIYNAGAAAWEASVHGSLYYDDESQDTGDAVLINGISFIGPGERVIVLVTDNANGEINTFTSVWSPVVNLTGLGIGFADGSGLGSGGDGVTLWVGDPTFNPTPVDFEAYPDTVSNDGQSYDVELAAFSTVGNASNAVATIALGGDANNVPNIASPGNVLSFLDLEITEIFPGQDGTDLTEDWFEIINNGTLTWTSANGDLYYDDESADPLDAIAIQGITDIQPGERVIVIVDGDASDATTFVNIWSPVINLANIEVGYADNAAGLGGGGDTVTLWLGDPNSGGTLEDSEAYPDTSSNDGQSYDVELAAFSTVGNASNAVQTDALGGDGGNVPNIGSPGNMILTMPEVEFDDVYDSVSENDSSITLTATISEAPTSDVTVDVALVLGGTATEGVDFTFASTQTLTFPSGSTDDQTINIPILDNSDDGSDLFFVVMLENANGVSIGSEDTFSVYILDDDTVVPAENTSALNANYLTSYLVDASGTAEITAYDATTQRLFVTNDETIEILDFSDPSNISSISTLTLPANTDGVQSVAVSNGILAAAIAADPATDPGLVMFSDTDGNNQVMVTVGALPDMITFTPDGTQLLVANEGEPNDLYDVDPEGGVSVIDVTGGLAGIDQSDVTNLGFTAFNGDLAALLAADVRIFGPGATVAQDLEPEYITVSDDSQTAYVALQENNAYAIVDLTVPTITQVVPFGLKDHSLPSNSLDTSDETDFIFNASWPIYGMYMPDAIDYFNVGGTGYVITANEGDARDYDGYAEERKLDDSDYVLDPAVFGNADILALETNLGDINITIASGNTDADPEFEEIHVYGGRSFSIFEANTGNLIYDSGNDFEVITAADATYGGIFNASNSNNSFKNRSDNKGPEPEGVIVEEIEGSYYAFILLERVGGVMIYDVTDPAAPVFLQYLNSRGAVPSATASGDLGPEGIVFVDADDSPTGTALIVVSNEVSATLSIYSLDNILGLEEFNNPSNEFKMFPNPASQVVNFNRVDDYRLYDMSGRLVKTVNETKSIKINDLEAGIYFVANSINQSKKLIVE